MKIMIDFNSGMSHSFVSNVSPQLKWERYNQAMLDALPTEIAVLDGQGRILIVNQTWRRQGLNAIDPLQVVHAGTNYLALCSKLVCAGNDAAEKIHRGIVAVLDGSGSDFDLDYVSHGAGQLRWIRMQVRRIASTYGRVLLIHADVSAQQAVDELRKNDLLVALDDTRRSNLELHKLSQVVEQNPESILITNLDAEIEYVNNAFLEMSGYTRDEVLGKNPKMFNAGNQLPGNDASMWQALQRGETWEGEFYNRRKDGSDYVDFATVSPIRQADGKISHYVSIQENITSRKMGEARIYDLAFFDQLTRLPNRMLMEDRLNQLMAISARQHEFCALLFIDLDKFKNVNDTLGHHVGDQMLKSVAKCLVGCVRDTDTVARFGGDEFIVLLPALSHDEKSAAVNAKATAMQILARLDQIYQLGETVMHGTASIGVTLFHGDSVAAAQLLKQADMAMYQSKEGGRNMVRFFNPSLEVQMKQRAMMEDDLRTAVREQQFILHYQPQYNQDGVLTGAEVLVRWVHPTQGVISPTIFIPFAEDNGFILQIGEWVLEKACRQLTRWTADPAYPAITLAVNVSAIQFKQHDFVEVVRRVVERSGTDPARLKLELTESMLVDKVEEIIDKMLILQRQGIRFALDDFGTGYSSLSLLKQLPLDQLKIDQSFVRHILDDPSDAAIAKTIITLASSLGLGVIAEGVEAESQREFLCQSGCPEYQGYLFAKPMSEQDFEELMLIEMRSRVH